MIEFADFPKDFFAFKTRLPEELRVRERVLSPGVFVERTGTKLTAKLTGVRRLGGETRYLFAPTNAHSWVVDGKNVFPLPADAAFEFLNLLGSENPESISYAFVVKLLSSSAGDFEVHVDPSVLTSGATSAEAYIPDLQIAGLNAKLYPYQARGVQWLWDTIVSSGGAILADEMGLGKTLQVIALLAKEPPPHHHPALIVCPTSLITNWVRELEKFAPALTVDVHRGPNRTGVYRGLQVANVVITTYDTMVNDITIFSAFEWSWVICDEAQALKNPESNRRKCVARIPRKRSLPMTGTPVENSLLDLWSLADFAIPGLLGDRTTFAQLYPDSTESASKLNSVVDPVILKRRVAEVADDLPERIDIDVPIEMSDGLRVFYLRVRDDTIDRYPVAGALVATLQLQLVCAHPWLVSDDVSPSEPDDAKIIENPGIPLNTEKMDVIVGLLREAFLTKKKVLVFTIFNRLGDLIRRAAADLPEAYWNAINGSTPQSERQTIIDEFSSHAGPGCLLLNPKAAGAGLNITAATVVVHTSPVWNPALESQASARAHRRGQDMPVTVYRLFYEGTVERVMLDRSIWRGEMGNEIAPVSTRDADDLKRAFEIEPVNP